ncbi:MAG: hypothetical protein HQM16_01875 [Deltaproteobacteria bacterium]|nr:hypothetical protein [Deltaproteobacteria bacterium]
MSDFSLNDWFVFEAQRIKRAKVVALLFITCVSVFFFLVIYISMVHRTKILLSVDDFSFDIPEFQKRIFFSGIVPFEVLDDMSFKDIKQVKIYFSPEVETKLTQRKKTYVDILSSTLTEQEYSIRDENLKEYRPKLITIKSMRAAIFYAEIASVDKNGVDLHGLLLNEDKMYPDAPIHKVKLVMGEVSLFTYWKNKLFSTEPLYKRAGQLMD